MTPRTIKRLLNKARKEWGSWAAVNRFFDFTSESGTQHVAGTGKANGPTRRMLELLRLYGKHAPMLWNKEKAKQIKPILEQEDDDGSNSNRGQ